MMRAELAGLRGVGQSSNGSHSVVQQRPRSIPITQPQPRGRELPSGSSQHNSFTATDSRFLVPRQYQEQSPSDNSDVGTSSTGVRMGGGGGSGFSEESESSEMEEDISDEESDEDEVSTIDSRKRNLYVSPRANLLCDYTFTESHCPRQRECGQYYLYGLTSPFRFTNALCRTASQRTLNMHMSSRDGSPSRKERHILMLPGLADVSAHRHCECESDDICWRKNLPKDVPLSRTEHDL